ncbi:hypothetical protein cypCar_00008090 [Cyprinus carpio]|nr:hypothetical protein cypCar_00008090 [Cyprinus carpio]
MTRFEAAREDTLEKGRIHEDNNKSIQRTPTLWLPVAMLLLILQSQVRLKGGAKTGMGRIYMNEVQCHGDEKSLWDCPHKSITAEDCKHMEDVSVICNILYMGFEKSIRMTGGRTRLEGSVELLLSTGSGVRDWGLVCGDRWTSWEAMVVCRQLGLGHASSGLRVFRNITSAPTCGEQGITVGC